MFGVLPDYVRCGLEDLIVCINKTFPVPKRFAPHLGAEIAALSRLLTSARSERDAGYLGRANFRSAYLRFFLPWNVFRLCKLFAGKDGENRVFPINPPKNGVCADLGSGTLTTPLALWICFPQLRETPLVFYCLDSCAKALEDGITLFNAFTTDKNKEKPLLWTIKPVKTNVFRFKLPQKADLITAFNLYNELFGAVKQGDLAAMELFAQKTKNQLSPALKEGGGVLIAEPGIPRSGQFLSLLRTVFINSGYSIKLPCAHDGRCPAPGGKKGAKWCHFVFPVDEAPAALQAVSREASLEKEKATVSFLYAEKNSKNKIPASRNRNLTALRVISGSIRLSGAVSGVYCCSKHGLVLALDRENARSPVSGDLIYREFPQKKDYDKKSGALIV
ncbi:MAG: rRNA methyltransferase [Spirochaetaceae bacterium]|jgi:ribosomal protein RSM22 (predicted rRNA methylase)|nr:rRNA methyltransferase [Spirochaetaceae bacterium]